MQTSVTVPKAFMDVRESRGIVKDYHSQRTPQGIQPPNDFKAMEQMWKSDDVVSQILIHPKKCRSSNRVKIESEPA